MYKCECGREFEKRQSFIAHCGHCKVHLGEERYNKNIEIQRQNQKKASEAQARNRSERAEASWSEYLNNWILEENKCETCGKVMTEYYGSGRFCCEFCARRHSSNSRSDETKEYCASFLKHEGSELPGFHKLTHEERCAIMKEVANRPESKERFLKNCIPASHTPEVIAKQAETHRISYREGRNKGWTTRSNVRTDTEIFWDNILYQYNIPHIQEHSINKKDLGITDSPGCYRLDFLITDGKIDLEIDGRVHRGSRLEHDEIRDSVLERNGYIVHRIPAIDPNDYPDEVNKQVEDFLKWYKNFLSLKDVS